MPKTKLHAFIEDKSLHKEIKVIIIKIKYYIYNKSKNKIAN